MFNRKRLVVVSAAVLVAAALYAPAQPQLAAAESKPAALLHPPLYSPESPFNRMIPPNPAVDPGSAAMVGSLIEEARKQGFLMTVKEWTVPVYYASANTKRYDVRLTASWAPYRTMKGVPIPSFATPDAMSDRHMAIIDLTSGCEYDFWRARKALGRWTAAWGNALNTDSDGVFPKGVSARGSGFGLLAGMIWPDELRAGRISHALSFSYSNTKAGGPVPPATESDGDSVRAGAIPEGARIQLNPALDLDRLGLTPTERIIARALQEYGMFLSDDGGGITLYAVHPKSVSVDPYAGLFSGDVVVRGDRFGKAYVMLDRIPVPEFRVLRLAPQVRDPPLEVVPNGCAEFRE
ncbi:MAG: hypothetical protein HY699_17815 [Deltaproteobacteria bacterium]|nr:hypothetical protein [Deltaproteobacteria bacterium]